MQDTTCTTVRGRPAWTGAQDVPSERVCALLWAACYHFRQILKGVLTSSREEEARTVGSVCGAGLGAGETPQCRTPEQGSSPPRPQSCVTEPSGRHNRITDTGVSRSRGQGLHTGQVQRQVGDGWNPAVAPASYQLSLAAGRPRGPGWTGATRVAGRREPTRKRWPGERWPQRDVLEAPGT